MLSLRDVQVLEAAGPVFGRGDGGVDVDALRGAVRPRSEAGSDNQFRAAVPTISAEEDQQLSSADGDSDEKNLI
jgi:hypothetical protein